MTPTPTLYNPRSKRTLEGQYLYEIAPDRWVTRQRVWSLRKKMIGGCLRCGRPVSKENKGYCETHRRKAATHLINYKLRKSFKQQ